MIVGMCVEILFRNQSWNVLQWKYFVIRMFVCFDLSLTSRRHSSGNMFHNSCGIFLWPDLLNKGFDSNNLSLGAEFIFSYF